MSFNKHFSQTRGTKIQSLVRSTMVYVRIVFFLCAYFSIIMSLPYQLFSVMVSFFLTENQMLPFFW